MSDTLLEPEDQMSEHQVTKSGTCVIPGCPCCGWSAQETAGAIAFVDGTLRDAKDTSLLAVPAEHQPAARGGGDDALSLAKENHYVYGSDRSERLLRAVMADREQHHSLVAERERWEHDRKFLGDRLEAQAETMAKIVKERNQYRLALEIIRDSFWTESEPFEERVEYLQETAKDILETVQNRRSE